LKNYTKVDFRAAFLKLSRCKRTILRLLDKPMVTFRRVGWSIRR
jgi:hypothetical protein